MLLCAVSCQILFRLRLKWGSRTVQLMRWMSVVKKLLLLDLILSLLGLTLRIHVPIVALHIEAVALFRGLLLDALQSRLRIAGTAIGAHEAELGIDQDTSIAIHLASITNLEGRAVGKLLPDNLVVAGLRRGIVLLEPTLLEVTVTLLTRVVHLLVATHAVHGGQHAL